MEKQTFIKKTYTQDSQHTYQRISFTVDEQIEYIKISYDYQRFIEKPTALGMAKEEINIIDLGLFSPDGRLRGWSGSERLSIVVSEAFATPGYTRSPIAAGIWEVALGIYKVASQVDVSITITLIPKERRFFKGDLHTHTLNSDGIFTTTEVITYAKHAKLDFIALTDHNNTQQNDEIGNPEGITVLPGMEYTNYRGHACFFFSDSGRFTANPLSNTKEEMIETFNKAKDQGALISLNHPFDESCPWLFGFDMEYQLVEVWNGLFKSSDQKAVAWWHQQLVEGNHLVAVGGSDIHQIGQGRSFGTPTTWIHALSPGKEDLLTALKQGRVSISATPTAAQLDLIIGGAHLGETIIFSEDLKVNLLIYAAKAGDTVILYSDQGEEQRWTCPCAGKVTFVFSIQKRKFYRAELYRTILDYKLINALTNPVYLA